MTLDGLVAEIENLFECRDGTYDSYLIYEDADGVEHHIRYRTLSWISVGTTFEDLRRVMLDHLLTIAHDTKRRPDNAKPILYWRYAKERRIDEETQRRPFGKGLKLKIRTRVAIPGYDWPDGSHVVEGTSLPEIDYGKLPKS
jgi:hypothetical protein